MGGGGGGAWNNMVLPCVLVVGDLGIAIVFCFIVCVSVAVEDDDDDDDGSQEAFVSVNTIVKVDSLVKAILVFPHVYIESRDFDGLLKKIESLSRFRLTCNRRDCSDFIILITRDLS